MKLFCKVKDCMNFMDVDEALVKETTMFTCRDHVPPGPDNVRFQNYQFESDLDLGRGGEYIGDIEKEGDDTSDIPDPNILP